MVPILILAIVFGSILGFFSIILKHRERMAEIEASRPNVVLQLPEGTSVEQMVAADELTHQIALACKEKGIDVDVDFE